MTVLLTILKIIGWIVVILLAAAAALILMILFVPVTYRLAVGMEESFRGRARVSWLFRLISLYADYEDGRIRVFLRICGFKKTLVSEDGQQAGEETKEELEEAGEELIHAVEDKPFIEGLEKALGEESLKHAKEELAELPELFEDAGGEWEADTAVSEDLEADAGLPESGKEAAQAAEEDRPGESGAESRRKSKKKKSKKKRAKKTGIRIRLDGIFSGIRGMEARIRGMIENIRTIAGKVRDLISDQKNQAAFSHLKQEVFRLLKIVKPSHIRVDAQFSAGEPDKTGLLLGALAVFPTVYRERWRIVPDFTGEKPYCTGEAQVEGNIFLFRLAGILFRIVKDKNCRRLYRRIRDAAENI